MNVAEVLVKALEHEHVEYMFGIPGEENLYIMKALKESGKIKVVIVRHEQGAAFMADVYGRLTGRAGVCFSTLGPGATNLITGVADANSDGAPLVAITAQVSTDKMPLTSHQYLDLETLFQPITRRTKMIVSLVRPMKSSGSLSNMRRVVVRAQHTFASRRMSPQWRCLRAHR